MTPHEAKRAAAAVELADALLEEFNNPSSALKGIGRTTMEKLLIYLKISEQAQRRRSKRAKGKDDTDEAAAADPDANDPEDSDAPAAPAAHPSGDADADE